MVNNCDLALRVFEVVDRSVEGKVEELHVYSNNFSQFNIVKDGKKISVAIHIEEVEKDA